MEEKKKIHSYVASKVCRKRGYLAKNTSSYFGGEDLISLGGLSSFRVSFIRDRYARTSNTLNDCEMPDSGMISMSSREARSNQSWLARSDAGGWKVEV